MKAQQRYIHDIKKVFQFTGYRDRKYLKDLNQQINEFVLEFPSANYDTLVKEFGNPKEIIAAYYKNTKTEDIIGRITIQKYARLGFLIICLVAFFFIGVIYKGFLDSKKSIIEIKEIIVEEEWNEKSFVNVDSLQSIHIAGY